MPDQTPWHGACFTAPTVIVSPGSFGLKPTTRGRLGFGKPASLTGSGSVKNAEGRYDMGKLTWAAYEPPTTEELVRRQEIRDRIERLSVRPLHDTVDLHSAKRVCVVDISGIIAVGILAAALVITLVR